MPIPQGLAVVAFAVIAGAIPFLTNFALRKGLWGDFLFALAITSLGVWCAGRLLPRRVTSFLRVTPPRWWQAPLVASLPLIALPIVLVRDHLLRVGLFLAGVVVGYLVVWATLKRIGWFVHARPVWGGVATGMGAALLAAALATPSQPSAAAAPRIPGSDAVASRYRPLLFFDSDERFLPLSIDRAISTRRMKSCTYGFDEPDCEWVKRGQPIDLDADYLTITAGPFGPGDAAGGFASAYYHHVFRDSRRDRVYVDYWWYLAENPQPVGRKWFCGPGLRAIGISCHEHPADWEGITVILERCTSKTSGQCVAVAGRRYALARVHYAQHRFAVSYSWQQLQEIWDSLEEPDRRRGEHPLVWVALNSHASYPKPCAKPTCKQTDSVLNEGRSDGLLEWTNNDDGVCAKACLQALPTTKSGGPSEWNAFPAPWGAQHCILFGVYCDFETAPRAPAFQSRYRDPTRKLRPGRIS